MRNRDMETFDYKKGTRYLKSSGILLKEQSIDLPSLYAAAAAVSGVFCAAKKKELSERFDQAVYDGAYREAHLLILLLYWEMEERPPKFLKAVAANKPVYEEFCEMVSEQNELLKNRMRDMEKTGTIYGGLCQTR